MYLYNAVGCTGHQLAQQGISYTVTSKQ